VTPAVIEQYRKDGFVQFDDFWTSKELEEWRDATEEVANHTNFLDL